MRARAPAGCARRPQSRAVCRSGRPRSSRGQAARASDRLAPLFPEAPVPCAWNLTIVLSSACVSRSTPANASRCSSAASRSNTPALAQRVRRTWIVCQLPNSRGRRRPVQGWRTPDAALIEHVEPGVEHLAVRDLEMIARRRQQWSQPRALRVAQLLLIVYLVTRAAPPTIRTLPQLRHDVNRPQDRSVVFGPDTLG